MPATPTMMMLKPAQSTSFPGSHLMTARDTLPLVRFTVEVGVIMTVWLVSNDLTEVKSKNT